MPKMKTKRAAAKRFKLTGSGCLICNAKEQQDRYRTDRIFISYRESKAIRLRIQMAKDSE